MARQNVPGTVWKSHGSWHWRVKFPDEESRRDVVLTFPFSGSWNRGRLERGVASRKVSDRWDVKAYARAIAARTCAEEGIERWSPNRLRHACATAVRRRFVLAAA